MNKRDAYVSFARRYYMVLVLLVGCAGMERECASCGATNFGADWVVVQADYAGRPYRCWELRNTSISNEENSDGIYWRDGENGNLLHIAGHYNRVQVENRHWEAAFRQIGLTEGACRRINARTFDPTRNEYADPGTSTPPH